MSDDYSAAVEELIGPISPRLPAYDSVSETYKREATTYANNPDRLFNDIPPNTELDKEQPWHRSAVLLKAQGYSNTEIGNLLGYSHAAVSQAMRQPWARQRLVDEQTKAGRRGIELVLEGTALDSVNTLINLRDAPTTPANVKATCAMDLLNRVLGKPIQRTEADVKVTTIPTDMVELDRELEKVNADLNRINAKSN